MARFWRACGGGGRYPAVGSYQRTAKWFQKHFKEDDIVLGRMVDSPTVALVAP